MSESGTDKPEDRPAAGQQPRRRPVSDPFGDVLPDTTRDERDPESAGRDDEAWYRENRPPHHDQY
ncbi:MAG TPA: hypothetical protein VGJ28_13440 [Micromonosporaceae bacterium]|jgi:hypothetical protein